MDHKHSFGWYRLIRVCLLNFITQDLNSFRNLLFKLCLSFWKWCKTFRICLVLYFCPLILYLYKCSFLCCLYLWKRLLSHCINKHHLHLLFRRNVKRVDCCYNFLLMVYIYRMSIRRWKCVYWNWMWVKVHHSRILMDLNHLIRRMDGSKRVEFRLSEDKWLFFISLNPRWS